MDWGWIDTIVDHWLHGSEEDGVTHAADLPEPVSVDAEAQPCQTPSTPAGVAPVQRPRLFFPVSDGEMEMHESGRDHATLDSGPCPSHRNTRRRLLGGSTDCQQ
ncbi:hypothetical protein CLOP_g2250 [Closterium sp. NIES-67]|nr:hypothetical protein CLOP_g2250 [Closterium sp. NIES-67]